MPTPGGKLKTGDRLTFKPQNGTRDAGPEFDGVVFVVQERTSNDETYSVWICREDGQPFRWPGLRRDHGREAMLLEAHYHVFMTPGGWTLLKPHPRRGVPLTGATRPMHRRDHGNSRRPEIDGHQALEELAGQVAAALDILGFGDDLLHGPAAVRLAFGLGVLRGYADSSIVKLGPKATAVVEQGARLVRESLDLDGDGT